MNEIMVSVALITYNHDKYVRKAIESILEQKVLFNYEMIIGDDCSIDDTQEIIKEYVRKFPYTIRPILRKINIGATNNLYDVLLNCNGKYIALLEGDDYWIDDLKLQKQVNYLEHNGELVGAAHKTVVVNAENIKQSNKIYMTYNGTFEMRDYLKVGLVFHTSSLVFRNIFLNSPSKKYLNIITAHPIISDVSLVFLLLDIGNVFIIDEIMSVWLFNISANGSNYSSIITKKQIENSVEIVKLYKNIDNYFGGKYYINNIINEKIELSYLLIIKNNFLQNINHLFYLLSILTVNEKLKSLGNLSFKLITKGFRKICIKLKK